MATAAEIQASINNLQAARDSGVLRVKHGLDEVIYQSPESMDKAIARLKGELIIAQGGTPRSKVGYITQTSKGFGRWNGNQNGFGTDDDQIF